MQTQQALLAHITVPTLNYLERDGRLIRDNEEPWLCVKRSTHRTAVIKLATVARDGFSLPFI